MGESGKYPFFIAGLGTSSGGLEALTRLLSQFPDHTETAFVVIQHLEPKRKSELTRLLSKITKMPVTEATGNQAVRSGHIYVTPPDCYITIAQGILHLSPRGEAGGLHLPIDCFLDSLAEDQQDHAIGVILSGTGSDGTLGISRIKAAGGLTFAQAPESSSHEGMPESAIAGGAVDFVLPPEEIARALIRVNCHLGAASRSAKDLAPLPGTDRAFNRILAIIKQTTGVDFSHYRETDLKRRILRRMILHKQETLTDYARQMEEDPTEIDALCQEILVRVTHFFRTPEIFEYLKAHVFPEIHQGKSPGAEIRVWVAGCSTGEEVYSLAMALLEFQAELPNRPSIRIFASDIDATALAKARSGVYSKSIEADISPERLARFFTKENGTYRIHKTIRNLIVFAKHDMTADPPYSRMDFISCRNVLTSMSPPLKERMLSTFHYTLGPVGFLLLGSPGTAYVSGELFREVDDRNGIYARKSKPTRMISQIYAKTHPKELWKRAVRPNASTYLEFEQSADRILARRFAPPGVMVNRELDILQFRGRTSPYLELPQNSSSFKLANMVHESLFLQLRGAVREADEKGAIVRRQGIRMREGGRVREVDLEVLPINRPGTPESSFLVLFEEPQGGSHGSPAPRVPIPVEGEPDQLQQDMVAARDYLHSLREQYDATNESLQSSNEELLSSNEELQTTIQELLAAKEEMDSANEVLTTLVEALKNHALELEESNRELNNRLTPGSPSGDGHPDLEAPGPALAMPETLATVPPAGEGDVRAG